MTANPKSRGRPTKVRPADLIPTFARATERAADSAPPLDGRARRRDLAKIRRLFRAHYRPVEPSAAPLPPFAEFRRPSRGAAFDWPAINIFLCCGATGEVLPPAVAKGVIERAFREIEDRVAVDPLLRYPFRPRRAR